MPKDQSPNVEEQTADTSQPQEVESQTPESPTEDDQVAAYRRVQSEKDRLAAEKAELERKTQEMSEQLKRRMDDEEREKYELAEQLSRERAAREQMEAQFRSAESEKMKSKVLSDFPDLKVFEDDLDFSGMSEDEAREFAKGTQAQLKKYVDVSSKLEKEKEEEAPPVESGKAEAGDVDAVTVEKFRELPRSERTKLLVAKGAFSADKIKDALRKMG